MERAFTQEHVDALLAGRTPPPLGRPACLEDILCLGPRERGRILAAAGRDILALGFALESPEARSFLLACLPPAEAAALEESWKGAGLWQRGLAAYMEAHPEAGIVKAAELSAWARDAILARAAEILAATD